MSDSASLQAVDRLVANQRIPEAISVLVAAAARQDREALFQLGFWQIVGDVVPRNLVAARSALRQAAALGHHEAQMMEIALTANGSGGAADWKAARRLLEATPSDNHQARQVLELIRNMTLDADGLPARALVSEPLSGDGTVSRVSAFLTPAECRHLMHSAEDLLTPALVVDPRSGLKIINQIRTSDTASIGPLREDLAIRAINMRIAELSNTSVFAGETLTILRYQVGQQFRLHSDALPASRNQRIKTVIIYLNNDFIGGETVFPNLNLKVSPVMGDAIIFSNVTPDGNMAVTSNHAGLPVLHGRKWIATRWIRSNPFDIWKGSEVPIRDSPSN
jgi:prolyl 4-hydroxylase